MGTDYKDLFNKKNYKNLFDNVPKKDKEQEKKMAYKNVFGDADKPAPKKENTSYDSIFDNKQKREEPKPTKIVTVLPPKHVDPRHAAIAKIDPNVPTNTVIMWLDNFDAEIARFGNINRVLSEDELTLAQNLNLESECVRDLFENLKTIVSVLNQPVQKKKSFISKLLSSEPEEVKITNTVINSVVANIRSLMETHKVKQKYKNMPFIHSEIRVIEGRIEELKKYGACAIAACKYRMENGDPDSDMVLDRVMKILQIATISESALMANNQILKNDLNSYEELRDIIIPLLYAKIQRLMTDSLDTEVMDIVSKISAI